VQVEQFVPNAAIERFNLRILGWFGGSLSCSAVFRSALHCSIARLVNSLPRSNRIDAAKPRSMPMPSKVRMTSRLPNENATSIAKHSRVKSSMTTMARNGRPKFNRSWMKSIDQRSFACVHRRDGTGTDIAHMAAYAAVVLEAQGLDRAGENATTSLSLRLVGA
jgi:hypothetical protein